MKIDQLRQALKIATRLHRRMDEASAVAAAISLAGASEDRLSYRQALLAHHGIREVGGQYRFKKVDFKNDRQNRTR